MIARFTTSLVAFALSAAVATAEEMPSEAVVSPITKAGVSEGCSVQYTAVSRDHIYMAGAPIGISGSLAWVLHPKAGIGLAMKLIAADIDERNPNSLRPFQVAHGFVRVNDKVVQVETRYACDQPTGFCGAIGMDKAMQIFEHFAKGGEVISFGLNRTKDGMDVDISVPTLNSDQSNKLNTCMLTLLEEAEKRMEDKVAR
jgi:hypothetical protein